MNRKKQTYSLRSNKSNEQNFALPVNPENSDVDGDSDSSDENDDESEPCGEIDSGSNSDSDSHSEPESCDESLEQNENCTSTSGTETIWTDICAKELQAWIGMHILMGIHQLPRLRDYWSSDSVLRVEAISNVMTRDRFKQITASIHLNSNDTMLPRGNINYDKLYKVRPLIEVLNKNIKKHYRNSMTVAVDESMILFKGRSTLKQYNPMKPIKRGYKVWCLAASQTGYVLSFEVYTGKSDSSVSSGYTLGERVVIQLTDHLRNTGILVAFDKFFTSVNLMKELKAKQIFATKGCVGAIKWMDSKPVTILTTVHNPTTVTFVTRKNKDGTKISVPCREAISAYNKFMAAVDRFDHFKERYGIGRRSKKWWH
ncbi:piggyBac transposable element-derived protein 4-like [Leptopilina boulardi]|uniref:piggyBac transposable element-derived protein 4-like n=1 Tax=Leptopilina boulardi TaxID=63433 RepID=UPI0021F6061A|nr:piggyBac transposable element-derived protein 4-like [Leptopilina boulardi]